MWPLFNPPSLPPPVGQIRNPTIVLQGVMYPLDCIDEQTHEANGNQRRKL